MATKEGAHCHGGHAAYGDADEGSEAFTTGAACGE